MRVVSLMLVVCLVGCTMGQPPPEPPVPPMPDDLSTWSVPDMVQESPPVQPKPHVQWVKDNPPTPAEKIYAYAPGGTYTVPVSIGFPLDIVFGKGEHVHNVTDGDRAPQADGQTRRWEVRQGVEGLGEAQRHHVFVTATEPGLRNGLTITTTARAYYVTLESVPKSPVRVLRWKYEPEPVEVIEVADMPQGPLPHPDAPRLYHVGYQVSATRQPAPTWTPRHVVDDGKKTYLIYPEVALFETVPLVRMVGPNGPQLVNSRQFLNVVILDQLAPRLELRVGIGEIG